jgi:hypothetical protein
LWRKDIAGFAASELVICALLLENIPDLNLQIVMASMRQKLINIKIKNWK